MILTFKGKSADGFVNGEKYLVDVANDYGNYYVQDMYTGKLKLHLSYDDFADSWGAMS